MYPCGRNIDLAKLGLQYGCGKVGWKEFYQTYVFPANHGISGEPTSGLEPLSLAHYE